MQRTITLLIVRWRNKMLLSIMLVLELYPVLQATHQVAQVESSRRSVTCENSLRSCFSLDHDFASVASDCAKKKPLTAAAGGAISRVWSIKKV
jgi:hypothetical protein